MAFTGEASAAGPGPGPGRTGVVFFPPGHYRLAAPGIRVHPARPAAGLGLGRHGGRTVDDMNLAGRGAAVIAAVGGATARIGAQRDITVVKGGPETEGNVQMA